MRREVAVLAALAVLTVGCGEQAGDPDTTTGSPAAGEPSAAPTWPSEGCDSRVGMTSDYVEGAEGADTRREALSPYVPEGGHVVKQPRRPHRAARWLAVDAENEIVAAVGLLNSGNGWLVSTVEECAG